MSFLACPILCHQFVSTIGSDDSCKSAWISLATQALDIMDHYHLVNPQAHMLVDYLKQNQITTKYSTHWLDHTASKAETRSDSLYGVLLNSQSPSETYNCTMELLSIYTIQNRFGQALTLLQSYGSSAGFSTDPTTTEQITNHKYLQYLLFSYVISVYKHVWFEDVEDEVSNDVPITISPHKNLETYLKRANYFYNKKRLLLTEDAEREIRCYWLLRWMSTLVSFSQGMVEKFLEEFTLVSESSSIIHPYNCMELDGFSLKEPLLLAHGLSVSMMRPFSVALHLDDKLADLYSKTSSTNQIMTYLVLLKDSQFAEVHKLLRSESFKHTIELHGGFALPDSFLTRLQHSITFKVFILVIQTVKRIPRTKMLAIMGHEDNAGTTKLLLLMLTILGLAHFGVGYNTSGDYFYNTRQTQVPLGQEVDRLAQSLEGEAMSAVVNAALLEKIHRT